MTNELSARQFALLLTLTPHVGWRSFERVVRQTTVSNLKPHQFLALSADAKREEFGLKERAAMALTVEAGDLVERTLALERRLQATGAHFVTFQDAAYPGRLEEFVEDPPSFFFAHGNLRLLEMPSFCAVASRTMTPAGRANLEVLVERQIFERKVLISGHNTDAYKRAAITALRWGAPRILVLDCGIFGPLGDDLSQEPFRLARLYRYQFDPKTDLALSPFRPEDKFIGTNNQTRDELVAALSAEFVAVEVRREGQMEKLGLRAMERGRTVKAVAYPEYNLVNSGNRALLEAGAQELG